MKSKSKGRDIAMVRVMKRVDLEIGMGLVGFLILRCVVIVSWDELLEFINYLLLLVIVRGTGEGRFCFSYCWLGVWLIIMASNFILNWRFFFCYFCLFWD